MKNIPRIYLNEKIAVGREYGLPPETAHYLTRVMRTDKCLVFNDGAEYEAEINNALCFVSRVSPRKDPSNNLTLCFAPIKQSRMEEMSDMATQMGVAKLQPVLTDHTAEKYPKWGRIEKIIIEASEQSGRNSVPILLPPVKFADLPKKGLIFGDERKFAKRKEKRLSRFAPDALLIGPEGGFSAAEFAALDASGAVGISLGPTILRAETAAVAAIAIVKNLLSTDLCKRE